MLIGGLEKLTLMDYPGEVAAIIFTQGCNFRCQFCYNPMLVWPTEVSELKYDLEKDNNLSLGAGTEKKDINLSIGAQKGHSLISEDDLFAFLKDRKGRLDAVVISGGEPTLHTDLPEFIAEIKALGYKVKLDSNGTNPKAFLPLLTKARGGLRENTEGDLIDYIAMDIKAPLEKYELITQVPVVAEDIKESIKIIMASGLPYEFRSTIPPDILKPEDIAEMGQLIKGAEKWYLQFFKSDTDLVNKDLQNHKAYTDKEMRALAEIGQKYVKMCEVRG